MKKSLRSTTAHSLCATPGLLAALLILAMPLNSMAEVDVNLNLWHGYGTFYGQVSMTATNPAPITNHRVESPNGKIWRERSESINEGSFTNLGYSGLLDECTNGLWTLTLNEGDPSEEIYTFSLSLSGITSNMFGEITMISPLYGAEASANPPDIQWSSTSLLPEVFIVVNEDNFPYAYGDSVTLPGTATNWTPSVALSPADQGLLIQYQSNNVNGIAFSVPTNIVGGAALPGWSASADLLSYLYSGFRIAGGGDGGGPLDEAVESPGLEWTTGGDIEGWFVQSNITYFSNSALQSGFVSDDESSWIETTVQGPGTLIFYWNMLADDNDYFSLTVSNQFYQGEDFSAYGYDVYDWDSYEVYLEEGPNTLRWTFSNDDDTAGDLDAAFLDWVEYYPVVDYEVDFELNIQRVIQGTNDYYVMFPRLNNVYPPADTYHEVYSPNYGSSGDDSGSSSSAHYDTLADLINEIEGGEWYLSFNVDSAGYREYYFTMTADNLNTNTIPPVLILNPPEGAGHVAPNAVFQWFGPMNFDALSVYDRDDETPATVGFASLPVASLSWPDAPTLPAGTNSFTATYTSNNFAGLTISEPMDWDYHSPASWSTDIMISSSGRSRFVVSGGGIVPMAVTMLPPMLVGGDFGLSFISQSGATHFVEYTTNLVTGPWMPSTNFPGDGTTNLFMAPATNPAAYYRIETQ